MGGNLITEEVALKRSASFFPGSHYNPKKKSARTRTTITSSTRTTRSSRTRTTGSRSRTTRRSRSRSRTSRCQSTSSPAGAGDLSSIDAEAMGKSEPEVETMGISTQRRIWRKTYSEPEVLIPRRTEDRRRRSSSRLTSPSCVLQLQLQLGAHVGSQD